MWGFNTSDEAEVAKQVDYLLFDILTDPTGEFADAPAERSYADAAAPEYATLVIATPRGPAALADETLEASESRSELRAVICGIVAAREATKDAEERVALHHYLGVAYARLDVLVARDGA